jgi:hypothetical protein
VKRCVASAAKFIAASLFGKVLQEIAVEMRKGKLMRAYLIEAEAMTSPP